MNLKAQISVEYMFIVGFATMIILPLLIVYYQYNAQASDTVASSQALQVARKIADASETVYYLGAPSQITLKLNFPDKIYSTNLSNKEVLFRIKTVYGITDIVEVSSVNMNGTLPTSNGVHFVTVKAQDGFVSVTSN